MRLPPIEPALAVWTGPEIAVILARWEALERSGLIRPDATDAFLRRLEALSLFADAWER